MSGFNADAVGVAKGNPGGYAWVADSGTTVPTSASTSLGSAFVDLGYISEDGVVNSTDQDTEERPDWAGSTIKLTRGTFSETYQVTFLQTEEAVLKVIYGDDNVSTDSTTGEISVAHNGSYAEERVYVFESLIDESTVMRTVIPRGVLMERGDVSQNSSDLLQYEATLGALADTSGNSSYAYYYTATSA